MQQDRGALLRRERAHGVEDLRSVLTHLVATLARLRRRSRTALREFSVRDAERRTPHPRGDVAHLIASPDHLRERLSHRILRDLHVPGVGEQRPHHTRTLLAVDTLHAPSPGQLIDHHLSP
jgi:hypothetical protein